MTTYPDEFIYKKLMIKAKIIHSAYRTYANKLLFLASSCICPKFVEQQMREDAISTGVLDPTDEPFATAKIAGI